MKPLKIDIKLGDGFTEPQKEKIASAVTIVGDVVNSEVFKEKVHKFKWRKGFKTRHYFHMSNGLSNEEVFERVISGTDLFNETKDGDIDIHIHPFFTEKRTIGYTTKTSYETHINTRYLDMDSFTVYKVAANLLHEYCHNLGFGHDKKIMGKKYRVKHYRRTVPYGCGEILIEAATILKQEDKDLLADLTSNLIADDFITCYDYDQEEVITFENLLAQRNEFGEELNNLMAFYDKSNDLDKDRIIKTEQKIQELNSVIALLEPENVDESLGFEGIA